MDNYISHLLIKFYWGDATKEEQRELKRFAKEIIKRELGEKVYI